MHPVPPSPGQLRMGQTYVAGLAGHARASALDRGALADGGARSSFPFPERRI